MHNFSCAFPRRACPGLLARFSPAFVRLKNTDFSAGLTAGDFPRAWASVILAGKRNTRHHSITGFGKRTVIHCVQERSFITSLNKNIKLTFRVEKRKRKMKLFGVSIFLSSNLTVSIGYYEVAHETKRVGIRLPTQSHNEIRRYIDPVSWLLKCIHHKVGHHFYP